MTETIKLDAEGFVEVARSGDAPWLGPRARCGVGFIQRLELEPLARIAGVAA